MTKVKPMVAPLVQTSPSERPQSDELVLGTLAQYDPTQGGWVAQLNEAPVQAQTTIDLCEADVGRTVVLRFLRNQDRTPVIVGFLKTPSLEYATPRPQQAQLDGKKVVLTADRQIELKCGRASLVLHRDGRIELRGTEVVSRASRQQKIQGGSVQIN